MPRASNKGLRPLVTLGLALREARRAAGVTQAELAERCDLNVNYVSLLERGERNPTASTLFAIAAALAVPPHEFFREIGPLDLKAIIRSRSRRGRRAAR
jgi:transcriptional regulator with XRE-family HTH domain